MKNFLKKNYFGFFIGIIFSSVFIVYASSYIASAVGFTSIDSSWNVDNVKEATDSLYYKAIENYPVGEIISFMGVNAPEYFLACDGTVYNINDYPLLAEQIKTNFGDYNFFGGNGTTTFAVPNLSGEFLRGATSTVSAGTHQDASLPNIKGKLVPNLHATTAVGLIGSGNGVFTMSGSSWEHSRTTNINGSYDVANSDITFDASRSNSTYQDGAEAKPANTSVLYIIRYE